MVQMPSFFGSFAHKESTAKQDLMSSTSAAVLPNLLGSKADRAGSKVVEPKAEALDANPKKEVRPLEQPLSARSNATLKSVTWDAGAKPRNAAPSPEIELHIRALRDKKVSARYHAAETLATLGSRAQAAAPQLCQALLQDESALVRKSAATALGDLGVTTERAIADLRQAEASDEDQYVRQRARHALRTLGLL